MLAKAEEYNTKKPELAGYEELRKMDPRVLASTEKLLFTSLLATGSAWVLAGIAVACKQLLP
jgi:hypothetical protein